MITLICIMLCADPRYKVFGVMAGSIVLVGGLVGGMVGILLPKLSTGLVLGTVISPIVCVVRVCQTVNDDCVYRP